MEKKSKLLTIGQFAALHGINKKTLMWYDEIGLFHPSFIHPENGYRYYSYYQSALLETILLLRELDVPIDEIQAFMKNRSAASMEQLLQEKIEDLDRSMAHLRAVRKTLSYHRQNMQTLLTMDLSEISIVRKKERSLVTVDIHQDTTFDRQVEMITAETKKYQLRRLHDASYGTMIAVDSLQKGDFEDYSKLFIEIPFPIKKDGLHIQPAGDYVRAFYRDAAESPAPHLKTATFPKTHAVCVSFKSVNWFHSSRRKLNGKALLCLGELSRTRGIFTLTLMERLILPLLGGNRHVRLLRHIDRQRRRDPGVEPACHLDRRSPYRTGPRLLHSPAR